MKSEKKRKIDVAHDHSIALFGTAAKGSPFTNPDRWKPIFEGSPEIVNLRNVLVCGDRVSEYFVTIEEVFWRNFCNIYA